MALKVLYIGGTGEVSPGCITAGLELGHDITVFNRGTSGHALPQGVEHIVGDINDDTKYFALGKQKWDVVCQFRTFELAQCERDISTFAGNCGHFVFVSTAMVYQRPPMPFRITESETQLGNPLSPYATKKLAIERRLMEIHASGKMKITNVRPSHTFFHKIPDAVLGDLHSAWRWRRGKPILAPGDGTSLWTMTRSEDFGQAFARLLANPKAFGEAFHITSDLPIHWNGILNAVAAALNVEPKIVHVASDTLCRYEPKWTEWLLGDKSNCVAFDNTKVKQAAGGWECKHDLKQLIEMGLPHFNQRMKNFKPDMKLDALADRIIEEQAKLGGI